MRKIVRLTESDLVKIVKRVLSEQTSGLKKLAQYVTEYNHMLNQNGKTVKINKGDIWKQQGLSAEELDFMKHEKTGIIFTCDPSLGNQGFMNDNTNLYKFENAKPLIDSLRVKFCNGRQFNYKKYTSTECVQALKSGREGFQGCNVG